MGPSATLMRLSLALGSGGFAVVDGAGVVDAGRGTKPPI